MLSDSIKNPTITSLIVGDFIFQIKSMAICYTRTPHPKLEEKTEYYSFEGDKPLHGPL